ncbi:hypothetical protein OIO90_003290 [Microbotryomycetes sp. JL221]|nr:hypothetical protein OIO90_003290 [Microbotryomycetes sp. JL221]
MNPTAEDEYANSSDPRTDTPWLGGALNNDDDDDSSPHNQRADREERHRLYAVLNLEADCSPDDIVRSYKRLAALLHPDRHPDPALKQAADARFQQLNEAFEVLSDPTRRAIYDELGEKGLQTQWQVGTRTKTPAEFRAEFEKAAWKSLETNVESLVKSRGELTIIADARVLFLSDEHRRRLGGPQTMSITQKLATVANRQMMLRHSYTTPVSPNTNIVLTSQLLARNGAGGGNVVGKIVYTPSTKWSLQIGTTALRPRACTFRATYAPDSDSYITVNAPIKTISAPPSLTITMARRVLERVTAVYTLRTGTWSLGPWGRDDLSQQQVPTSSVTFGLNHAAGWALELTSAVSAQQVSGNFSRNVLGGFKVTAAAVATSEGAASIVFEGDRRVTENVRAGMSLDLGMTGTMTVKLRQAAS